jgi:hypothetical protein
MRIHKWSTAGLFGQGKDVDASTNSVPGLWNTCDRRVRAMTAVHLDRHLGLHRGGDGVLAGRAGSQQQLSRLRVVHGGGLGAACQQQRQHREHDRRDQPADEGVRAEVQEIADHRLALHIHRLVPFRARLVEWAASFRARAMAGTGRSGGKVMKKCGEIGGQTPEIGDRPLIRRVNLRTQGPN